MQKNNNNKIYNSNANCKWYKGNAYLEALLHTPQYLKTAT